MKKLMFIIFAFAVTSLSAQEPTKTLSKPMKEESTLHFIDVMEEISLNVLAESFVGEIEFEDNNEFENECLRRVKLKYTPEEIAELKNRIPENYVPPSKNQTEILEDLIKFTKEVFIPSTAELRATLKAKISEEERDSAEKNTKQLF